MQALRDEVERLRFMASSSTTAKIRLERRVSDADSTIKVRYGVLSQPLTTGMQSWLNKAHVDSAWLQVVGSPRSPQHSAQCSTHCLQSCAVQGCPLLGLSLGR